MIEALDQSALSMWLGQLLWGFPSAEIFHLLTVATFFGGIILLDLRMLGLMPFMALDQLMRYILSCVWIAFAGVVLSGAFLFLFMPMEYTTNPAFLLKMVLVVIGGLNAFFLHHFIVRDGESLKGFSKTPPVMKVSALVSVLIWCSSIACGRLIAYYYGYGMYG